MSDGIVSVAGFKIDESVVLKRHSTHRDISYEITNHGRSHSLTYARPRGTYCYYVYISEFMLQGNDFEDFWLTGTPSTFGSRNGFPHMSYPYEEQRWAQDGNWHGGVTWYSKEAGFDGEARCVKIGCDFGHYWDEQMYYTSERVEFEAKNTIDKLMEMYPFRVRDPHNGNWARVEDMTEYEGKYYTPEGLAGVKKWAAERAARSDA